MLKHIRLNFKWCTSFYLLEISLERMLNILYKRICIHVYPEGMRYFFGKYSHAINGTQYT